MTAAQQELFPRFSDTEKVTAEQQIQARQKETDFDIREYPVEVIVSKFVDKIDDDKAELFIPDYQREMIWKEEQQSRFIESILLNLPIPYLYVADVTKGENEGRLEIVDGSQRIRTLVRFMSNDLKLDKLEILNKLDGFYFEDLPLARQLRFKRKTLRMIEMIEVDEEARRQMFDRLNSGGTKLKDMEQRFGSRDGKFMTLIRDIALDPKFRSLCPIGETRIKHRDYEEMVLRFFAYRERYKDFTKRVDEFLDEYLDYMNEQTFDEDEYKGFFNQVLDFVEIYFPLQFRKTKNNVSVPRIRFEAIGVGASLALHENPNLAPVNVDWINDPAFLTLMRSDASNSRPKVINRIHFVRDSLLGRDVEYANDAE